MVVEHIDAVGIIQEENEDLLTLFPGYLQKSLHRLSFWRIAFKTRRGLVAREDKDLIGYMVLKQDVLTGIDLHCDGWHIFESVIVKYDHPHNCTPNRGTYSVTVGDKQFSTRGLLYCQQNSLNKSCAHVALRSLLSRLVPHDPLSYRDFNTVALQATSNNNWKPYDGLKIAQIRAILEEYSVNYIDIDYSVEEKINPEVREDLLYRRFIYSGIESGYGGLLGFTMSGPQARSTTGHIIPFYGHTFNKDTWAPDAELAYFNIGADIGYFPSDGWTSSFIGHDDNFGSNFCVPRLYISQDQVDYVVELMKEQAEYSGMSAEAQALNFLYSFQDGLDVSNPWIRRLVEYSRMQQVILRAICTEKSKYLEHLRSIRDWEGKAEQKNKLKFLNNRYPNLLWVVEISIPQLFPANERKIGEIILNAKRVLVEDQDGIDYNCFINARLPGQYIFMTGINQYGPAFSVLSSQIQSHVPLLLLE